MSDLLAYLIPLVNLIGAIGVHAAVNGLASVLADTMPVALLNSAPITLVEVALVDIWLSISAHLVYRGVGEDPGQMLKYGILSVVRERPTKYGLTALAWGLGWATLLVSRIWT